MEPRRKPRVGDLQVSHLLHRRTLYCIDTSLGRRLTVLDTAFRQQRLKAWQLVQSVLVESVAF